MKPDQLVPKPTDEHVPETPGKRAYEPPRVESIQLSGDAVEAPT
jgi:hypothetical protein